MAQMSEDIFQAVSYISLAISWVTTQGRGGQMDGQSFPGQAAGGIQKQAQLPAHLLSRRPAGLVLGGCGGKTRSGPLTPQLLFPLFSSFF